MIQLWSCRTFRNGSYRCCTVYRFIGSQRQVVKFMDKEECTLDISATDYVVEEKKKYNLKHAIFVSIGVAAFCILECCTTDDPQRNKSWFRCKC